MIRIEVYQDRSGTIVGDLFANQSEEPTKKLSEKDIFTVLNGLGDKKVNKRKVTQDTLYVTYNREKIEVAINEYNQISLNPIISKYMANVARNTIHKPKKVQRKNKYSKYGLGLLTVGAIYLITQATGEAQIAENLNKREEAKEPSRIEISIDETDQALGTNTYSQSKEMEYVIPAEKKETPKVKIAPLNHTPNTPKTVTPTYNHASSDYKISLSFEDERDGEKYQFVEANYGNLIEKYANMYGVDAKIIKAIATQERGVHSSTIDPGGGIGLMQVQYNVWAGHEVSSYNFETGEYETITVDGEKLQDLEYVIKIGTKIYRHYLERADYNVVAATFGYNKGITGVIATASSYLNDPEDLSWVEDARNLPNGDDFYPENVFRYVGEEELNIRKNDGSYITYQVESSARNRTH